MVIKGIKPATADLDDTKFNLYSFNYHFIDIFWKNIMV